MKIGSINITKAYLGGTLLTSRNAFLGSTKVIEGDEPVGEWGGLTLKFNSASAMSLTNSGDNTPNVQYSTNGTTWTTWDYSEIQFNAGDVVYLRGNNPDGFSKSDTQRSTFVFSGTNGSIEASGRIMSLIDGVGETLVIPSTYCFHYLFSGCTALKTAPKLTATTLTTRCYSNMFKNCSYLEEIHPFPYAVPVENAYRDMFFQCTKIKEAYVPYDGALTYTYCYRSFFYGCSSLNYFHCMATSGVGNYNQTWDWLTNVKSSGIFVMNINATYNILRGGCGIPYNWTIIYYDIDEDKYYLDKDKLQECDDHGNPFVQYCDNCGQELTGGVCTNTECTSSPNYVAPTCPECGTTLEDGVCPNSSCINSPYHFEETCPECGTVLEDGVCPNSSCTNSPNYIPPVEYCPECGMELVDGECQNSGCSMSPYYVPPMNPEEGGGETPTEPTEPDAPTGFEAYGPVENALFGLDEGGTWHNLYSEYYDRTIKYTKIGFGCVNYDYNSSNRYYEGYANPFQFFFSTKPNISVDRNATTTDYKPSYYEGLRTSEYGYAGLLRGFYRFASTANATSGWTPTISTPKSDEVTFDADGEPIVSGYGRTEVAFINLPTENITTIEGQNINVYTYDYMTIHGFGVYFAGFYSHFEDNEHLQ